MRCQNNSALADEAERYHKVLLKCGPASPSLRPNGHWLAMQLT